MCDATPPTCVSLTTPEGPRDARAAVRAALCRTHAALAEGAAELLTAELVTDAVRHRARRIELTVECRVTECLIEVVHRRTGSAHHQPSTDLTWLLVDKVAREWGVHSTQEVRSLWVTVPTGVVQMSGAGTPASTGHLAGNLPRPTP